MKQLFSLLLFVAFLVAMSCSETGGTSTEIGGTDTSSSSLSGNSSSSAGSGPNSSSSAGSSSSVGGSSSSVGGGTAYTCPAAATTYNNVQYGTRSNGRNYVDIKLPTSGNGPWPLVVFVHGGAWQGQGESENSVTSPFNNAPSKGYVLASVRYSVIGSAKAFPESVEDVLTAIRFLRANAACFKINPDKIGITGFSSGGYFTHIAAALSGVSNHGFDKEEFNVAGVPAGVSSKVQAAASCSGLSDFLLLDQHVTESGTTSMMGSHCGRSSPNGNYFGFDPCTATGANKELVDRSNPIKHIQAGSCADLPPVLSMHGTTDNIVPWPQSKLMADELNKKCSGKGTYYQHTGGHDCPSGYVDNIWQFLDGKLK